MCKSLYSINNKTTIKLLYKRWCLGDFKNIFYHIHYQNLAFFLNYVFLLVNLKYNQGVPVIKEISRVSKPGRRIYTKADSIKKIQNGLGIAIVSTSKGIMSDNTARSQNIGGEIICKVF